MTVITTGADSVPFSSPVLQTLALLQAEVGDQQQSLETLRKLAQAQPGVSAPLQRVAAVQAEKKQYDRATQTLRLAKKVAPADLTVSRDLIMLFVTAGRPDDALKEARAVQACAPRNVAGWLLESQVNETQRRVDDAERALRQGLKIEPDSGLLASRRQGVLAAGGKSAEADNHARKWIAEHPNDTVFRTQLGDRELATKRPSKAWTTWHARCRSHRTAATFG